MKLAYTLGLALSVALPSAGCAAIAASLPTIVAAVTDAALILDAIEDFIDDYFRANPNAKLEDEVRAELGRTRSALSAALRACDGTEALSQAKVDEAFAAFREAYTRLVAVTAPLGVRTGNTLAASPGTLAVPEPRALRVQVPQ